ncbi:MAG: hypothetical protein ACLTI1_01715 [Clostridia bacterium]
MSRNAEQKKRLEWLDFGKAMGILVVLAVHAGCSLEPSPIMAVCSICPSFLRGGLHFS